MALQPERNLSIIARGWEIARTYSLERLKRIHQLDGPQLERAIQDGRLVLETVCLLVHASIKQGQYSPPSMFWHMLHAEYGIIVYPSALTEPVEIEGLGDVVTYTEAYRGHVAMYGRDSGSAHQPPCPVEWMEELPPKYEEREPAK
ncbi:hypothetical protein XA68_16100 [Ophiocordyceps unilateralis]|uniref:Uncharacterized protein n=1 Tax=Ophiocordyceps unilateralis TaxID=268505 RepID=A0A2A9P6A1_OPHUN|nr:hypothetical protein XA68_16100 [Ophiocordyceps unilateralis]